MDYNKIGNFIAVERKSQKMTQAQLGEILNYSDKSISKWERAEAVPDALVLKNMAGLFGLTIDDLLTSHDEWKPTPEQKGDRRYNPLFIILSTLVAIFTACLLVFVVLWIFDNVQWLVLYAAVPACIVTLLVFNSIWYRGKNNQFIIMALVLSLLLLVVLLTLRWQLLLLLIPLEALVFLAFHIGKGKKPEKTQ